MTTRAGELERSAETARAESPAPAEADPARAPTPRVLRSSATGDSPDDGPMSLSAWAAATLGHWRIAVRTLVACIALAGLLAVVMRPVYRSASSFVAQTSKGTKLPQGLSGLAGLAGLSSAMSLGSDPSELPDFYVSLIESRELLTRLLDSRFANPRVPGDSATLLAILRIKDRDVERQRERAVKLLRENVVSVSANPRTGMVFVAVEMRWPELTAAVTNRAVAYVNQFNLEQRLSRVRLRRRFLEERQGEALRDLTDAETRLRNFYVQNRQPRLPPSLTFEEGRLQRQVEMTTEIYVGLRREFETARLDEVNDAPLITVVDSAVAARKRLRPRVGLLLVAGALVGAVLGIALASSAALADHWAARNGADAATLRRAWRGVGRDLANAGRRVLGRRPAPPTAS